MAQQKSEICVTMDQMMENLRKWREDFTGSRVPIFLMSKEQRE